MGPYPLARTMFFSWVLVWKWKNESFECIKPKRVLVMLSCLTSPVGKIHLLPSQVQCRTYCANPRWEWMLFCSSCFWLVVSWSVSLSPRLLWCISDLEMDIWIFLVSNLCWEFVPSGCYLMYLCILNICWNGDNVRFSWLILSWQSLWIRGLIKNKSLDDIFVMML